MRTVTILQGHVLDRLRELPDNSVHCVVTSPPYWGLRDYGCEGQIGLEKTIEEYVGIMVEVFREVRRVLRKDGVCFLNLGDSYAREGGKTPGFPRHWDGRKADPGGQHDKKSLAHEIGLKPKDLCGIPWRVALALQADGWWLRSDIIWTKPNPMPESVTDRPTRSHEYIFLLTKSAKYFWDQEAVREESLDTAGVAKVDEDGRKHYRQPWTDKKGQDKKQCLGSWASKYGSSTSPGGRNLRSVWTIPTHPFPEAHFATFPPALVEKCIKAGCPDCGTVLDPFMGSGTTCLVAAKLQKNSIGIELKPEYVEMAKKRIENELGMFIEILKEARNDTPDKGLGEPGGNANTLSGPCTRSG